MCFRLDHMFVVFVLVDVDAPKLIILSQILHSVFPGDTSVKYPHTGTFFSKRLPSENKINIKILKVKCVFL